MASKSSSSFPSLVDIASNAVKAVNTAVTGIASTFGNGRFVKTVKTATENTKTINEMFESVQKLLSSLMDFFTPKNLLRLNVLTKRLGKMNFSGISTGINNIIDAIKGINTKGIDKKQAALDGVIKLIGSIRGLIASALILGLVALPASLIILPGLAAVKLMIHTIYWVLGSLGKINKKTEKNIKSAERSLLMISATFVLFTLTLYTLGEAAVDSELWEGMDAFGLLIATTIGLLALISCRPVKGLVRDGQLTILAIGATFVLFALTLYTLGEASVDPEMISGMTSFAFLVGLAIGTLWAVSKAQADITKGALGLLEIGGAFSVYALVLATLNKLDMSGLTWTSTLSFIAIVSLSAGLMALLSKLKDQIITGALGMAIMAGALLLFIGDLSILNIIDVCGEFWMTFGALAAIIGLSAAVIAGLSFLTGPIILGTVAMAAMSVALLAFIGEMVLINKIADNMDFEKIFGFMDNAGDVIWKYVELTGRAILAGAASLVILPASLAMTAGISAIALGLISAKSVIDDDDAIADINTFIDALPGIMSSYSDLWDDALTLNFTAPVVSKALISASRGIKAVAESLNKVAKLDCDVDVVSETISNMVTTIMGTFVNIAKTPDIAALLRDEERDGGILGKIFGKKKDPGSSVISKVISATMSIGMAISNLAEGVVKMASLNIDVYDKNGHKIGSRKLTDSDFQLAGEGVAKLVSGFCTSIAEHKEEIMRNFLSTEMVVETAKKVSTAINGFGENIVQFASGKAVIDGKEYDLDFENAGKNIASLFTTIADSVGTIKSKNLIRDEVVEDIARVLTPVNSMVDICVKIKDKIKDENPGQTISNIIETIIPTIENLNSIKLGDSSAMESTAKSLDSVVNTINKVDTSKITKVNELVDKLKQVGQGINWNFDKLADTINGKLVDALEGVKEVLEETNKTLEEVKGSSERAAEAAARTATTIEGDTVSGKNGQPGDHGLAKTMSTLQTSLKSIDKMLKDISDPSGAVKAKITNSVVTVRNSY